MKKHDHHIYTIPTYIINLKSRPDRLKHINEQFSDKPEFDISIFEATQHTIGAVGLWQSTVKIVEMARQLGHEYILICEDDHQFTENYNAQKLRRCISEAQTQNIDVLLGGVHWYNSALKVSADLFWLDVFTATHFMIIYRKFFDTMLQADFGPSDISDLKISTLTDDKLVIYPFIATQKEFGYSDVTPIHNEKGLINTGFKAASKVLDKMDLVHQFYQSLPVDMFDADDTELNDITIPTYIIHLPEHTERLKHIRRQFQDKKEFDITVVEACRHADGTMDLWSSHQKIIDLAIKSGYDVIIICEDDHEFATDYSWNFLLKNILAAHQQDADMLSGGSSDFGLAVPLSEDRYWVNQMLSTQFLVIYGKFFFEILKYQENQPTATDPSILKLTNGKMLIYPPVSVQRDSGSAVAEPMPGTQKTLINDLLTRTTRRLKKINYAYLKYTKSSPVNWPNQHL